MWKLSKYLVSIFTLPSSHSNLRLFSAHRLFIKLFSFFFNFLSLLIHYNIIKLTLLFDIVRLSFDFVVDYLTDVVLLAEEVAQVVQAHLHATLQGDLALGALEAVEVEP